MRKHIKKEYVISTRHIGHLIPSSLQYGEGPTSVFSVTSRV